MQAYAAGGIQGAQVHVPNEPCSTQKFPSCVMTGAELRDFIGRRSWSANAVAYEHDGQAVVVLRNPLADPREVRIATPAGNCSTRLLASSFSSFHLPV